MIDYIHLDKIRYTLPALLEDTWIRLQKSAIQAKEGFKTGVLASLGASGISQRTVVLRKVIPSERSILIHTDIRSPKVAEIQAKPQISWLFYDDRRKLQLRMQGRATIHQNDAISESLWQAAGLGSLKVYLSQFPPGSMQAVPSSGIPKAWEEKRLGPEDVNPAKVHFCAVRSEIDYIDWLYLGAAGHRRAQFNFVEGVWQYHWVTP